MKKINRGNIFYADLDPIIGCEERGVRPVLIVQNNIGNKHSPTTMIAPITSRVEDDNQQPTHVKLTTFDVVRPNSVVFLEQIRTIDKSRLKGYVCSINDSDMEMVNEAIKISLGIK